MTIKKILTAPDPLLKTISKPVEKVDDEIRKLMDDMLETMYDAPGIGLAAVQVGVPLRVIVMDISWNKEDGIKEPKYFVNPIISNKAKDLSIYEEGCLSVPGFSEEIIRPDKIELKWQDLSGELHQDTPDGLLTICIQHEIDHLEGKLMVDYISPIKRDRIRKKLSK